MTVKEYLEQAYRIDERIESKLTQIESLKSLATRVTSVFSDMPHSSTPDNQRLEKTIVEIIDLENEILDDIDKLVKVKYEVQNTINSISDIRQRLILEMRYLRLMTWEQIAIELSLDLSWVHRLHGRALKKFSEKSH